MTFSAHPPKLGLGSDQSVLHTLEVEPVFFIATNEKFCKTHPQLFKVDRDLVGWKDPPIGNSVIHIGKSSVFNGVGVGNNLCDLIDEEG